MWHNIFTLARTCWRGRRCNRWLVGSKLPEAMPTMGRKSPQSS